MQAVQATRMIIIDDNRCCCAHLQGHQAGHSGGHSRGASYAAPPAAAQSCQGHKQQPALQQVWRQCPAARFSPSSPGVQQAGPCWSR